MAGISKIILATSLLSGVAIAMTGCGGRSFDYVGKWSANRNLEVPKGQDPTIFWTIGKVDLNMRSDGRFELLDGGVPKEGEFRVSGEKALLKVDRYFNRPISEAGDAIIKNNVEIEITPNSNGTITFFDPKGFDSKPIVLKRESQPSP